MNQIDKAIAHLEAEKSVLQLAIDRLRAQQAKAPTRKPRAAKLAPASAVADFAESFEKAERRA
jgi:hypothetical protein